MPPARKDSRHVRRRYFVLRAEYVVPSSSVTAAAPPRHLRRPIEFHAERREARTVRGETLPEAPEVPRRARPPDFRNRGEPRECHELPVLRSHERLRPERRFHAEHRLFRHAFDL